MKESRSEMYFCPDCGRILSEPKSVPVFGDEYATDLFCFCPEDGWISMDDVCDHPVYFRIVGFEWQDQDVYDGCGYDGWSKTRVPTSPAIITKTRSTSGYLLRE